MRRFIGTRSTANYRSAVAALRCISPFDPTLRARRSLSRVLARGLLPRNLEPLTYAFEELLGESAASARRLIHDWFFYRHLESESWLGARRQKPGMLLDAARIGGYLDASPRGVLVATIHLGDYLEGLRQLRLAVSVPKPVLVVRRRAWSEIEARAFARIASSDLPMTVVRTGDGAAMSVVRALRRGDIVVALYDLPRQFGGTVEVDFFGRRAQFVRGPAEIAVLGHADVLPLFTHYDADGVSVAEAQPVIAAAPCRASERAARTQAIAQRLCALAQRQIRAHPSQWSHWTFVRELLGDADNTAVGGVISAGPMSHTWRGRKTQ
ncbi:MAG TPA: lysophospholipid acyltransferase family protein [Pseudomonadales bacterium]|nr:lysophospholipid acyltransferase family protein [Pseudomonadales bacterium]